MSNILAKNGIDFMVSAPNYSKNDMTLIGISFGTYESINAGKTLAMVTALFRA